VGPAKPSTLFDVLHVFARIGCKSREYKSLPSYILSVSYASSHIERVAEFEFQRDAPQSIARVDVKRIGEIIMAINAQIPV